MCILYITLMIAGQYIFSTKASFKVSMPGSCVLRETHSRFWRRRYSGPYLKEELLSPWVVSSSLILLPLVLYILYACFSFLTFFLPTHPPTSLFLGSLLSVSALLFHSFLSFISPLYLPSTPSLPLHIHTKTRIRERERENVKTKESLMAPPPLQTTLFAAAVTSPGSSQTPSSWDSRGKPPAPTARRWRISIQASSKTCVSCVSFARCSSLALSFWFVCLSLALSFWFVRLSLHPFVCLSLCSSILFDIGKNCFRGWILKWWWLS